MNAANTDRKPVLPAVIRPAALQAGASVRQVSPASWFNPQTAQVGIDALRELGYKPEFSQNALARYGQYTAGNPTQRLEDLHAAFADSSVRAIICNRGGYGSAELLGGLDLDLVRSHPKILVGCSDITSLETWLHDATSLVVFHGPMAAGDFARENGIDLSSWHSALSQHQPWQLGPEAGLRVLKTGRAQGKFYGGCLSLLVASLGTPYEIQTEGTILFLEDIGAEDMHVARGRTQKTEDGIEQGALAGTRSAHDDQNLAGANRERNVLQDLMVAVGHGEMTGLHNDFPGALGMRS